MLINFNFCKSFKDKGRGLKLNDNQSYTVSSENSYSKALYELAEENKCLNKVEEQALAIVNLISQSEDFNQLLRDPTIKIEDQSKIMKEISNKFNFNELFNKFLSFLISKRRLFYVEKILKDFLAICSKMRGEISAKLIAAKELNENEIIKIKDELSKTFGSNIKLIYKYDKDLIGGLIVQVGSLMIDTSVKNKLKQLENKMIEV